MVVCAVMEKRIIIRKDRRSYENGTTPPVTQAAEDGWKRTYCWDLSGCTAREWASCYAYRTQRNCWDLWALRPLADRHCCQRLADCRECPIGAAKFPETFLVHPVLGKGLTGMRRAAISTLCPHLSMNGKMARSGELALFLQQNPPDSEAVLQCLQCRLRGTYLDAEYVGAVCASPHYRTCVFLMKL